MPRESSNVSEYLLAQGRSDDIAVIDRSGRHTYGELRRAVASLGAEIQDWRLPSGSRIGLLSRNSFFWIAAYLAIIRGGNIAVPFATTLTAEDIDRKASFVDCGGFLADTALLGQFGPTLGRAPRMATEEALTSPKKARSSDLAFVGPDADAVLAFTSGTTAAPRAVRVSHRNIQANTDSIVKYLDLSRRDRVLVVLPFSYCYGASLLHTHLRVGASLAICDTFTFPETAIEMIRSSKCTGVAGVPSTYQLLLRASSFESAPLPTLRYMQQAGGRLPPLIADRVADAQPHADLFVMYGQTEATARLSYLPPALRTRRRGSIGRGIPGVSLRVLDNAGEPVAPGTVGEVFAQGDNITKGYWADPAGTAAKFVSGGLRTGDLARVDEDGFIYIVDRQDDFIKSWGFRVSPHEIEDAVVAIPGVVAAAVVGRPDSEAGEAIVLFYVSAPDSGVQPESVLAFCRRHLARNLVPHEVRALSDLPLNANGKVVKSELRALAANQ